MNLYPALAELAQGDTRAAAEARRILTVHADLIGASSCQ
jgi:hypothetical protein